MRYLVECLVDFGQDHDLGPVPNVSLGDWTGWTPGVMREIRRPRISRRRYRRGERVAFATIGGRNAFLDHHQGKFRSL